MQTKRRKKPNLHFFVMHCSVDYNMQTNIKLAILSLDFFYCCQLPLLLVDMDNRKMVWHNSLRENSRILFFSIVRTDFFLLLLHSQIEEKLLKAILKWKCVFGLSILFITIFFGRNQGWNCTYFIWSVCVCGVFESDSNVEPFRVLKILFHE